MDQSTIVAQPRTGRSGLMAFLLFLAGAIPSGFVGLAGFNGLTDGLIRFVAPGSTEIELDKAGDYTVFYEYSGEFDGVDFETPNSVPEMQISLVADGDNVQTVVEVNASNGGLSYDFGSKKGRSIGTLSIESPGEYLASGEYFNDATEPAILLGLGYEMGRSIAQLVIGIVGLILASTIATVYFFVSRSRQRRAMLPGQGQLADAGFKTPGY